MEQQNELDMFLNHPFFFDILCKRMIKTLRSPTEKFVFTYVFLLGHKQKEAADVLYIHETNVSRHIKHIRQRLIGFRKGYEDTINGCKEKVSNKI
jgi:hypothetical protein